MSNLSAASDGFARQHPRAGLAFTTVEGEPARAGRRTWLASAALGFACLMAVAALLVHQGSGRSEAPEAVTPPIVAPQAEPAAPRWVEITRPFPTFDLAGGPYARLPMRYEATRDQNGSARQDTITFGAPQPGEAFLRMLFYRHGAEPGVDTTLFLDAARLAGTAGLAVLRSGLSSSLVTRFGAFEVMGVSVSRAERSSPCLSFRHTGDVLTVTGLMCGADAKPADLQSLACTLDKLDLLSAGEDLALRDWFLAAERQRGLGCLLAGPGRAATDPLRPIGASLRGSLPQPSALGVRQELSRPR